MSKKNILDFKKYIWIFWFQGWDNAPTIIKKCKKSWETNNPDWQIKLIDNKNINNYIDLRLEVKELNFLTIAHKSDLIRVSLLEKYGGVWVDASLFCIIPLDKWLFKYLQSGIFLFENDFKLGINSNWFIASEKNHKTISLVKKMLMNYWKYNDFYQDYFLKKFIKKIFTPILNFNKFTSRFWFNSLVRKVLKIYPYQIFYFIFEKIVRDEPLHKKIWMKTPKLNKYICWSYQKTNKPPSKKLILRIKNEFVPIIKLDWKGYKDIDLNENSLVNYLSNKKYLDKV